MKIVDCHVHVRGRIDAGAVLEAMDRNGIERTILISESERTSLDETRAKLEATRAAVAEAPDRLSGLARVNPVIPGVIELSEEALTEMGFIGIKIIPDHWFAHEERLQPFWEKMNELKASILFHTGILYGFEDNSRFCKPLYLEALIHYPQVRFAMAHISWPWCEECLAVMGRMKAGVGYGKEGWQSYIDITPGPPSHIRKEALKNALSFCGAERLMFGTDASVSEGGSLSYQDEILKDYLRIFDELELDDAQRERILSGTAEELFPATA